MTLLPKPIKKKSKLRQQQADRMKLIAPVVIELDHSTCRANWIENTGNLLDDRLSVCHIIGRDVRHPEYDQEWNLIVLRTSIHDMFDGRRPNYMDLPHKEFQVEFLECLFSKLCLDGLEYEFRWHKSLEYKINHLYVKGLKNDYL